MTVTHTVTITNERTYEVNWEKIEHDFAKELAEDRARGRDEAAIRRDTFYELCGWDRDEDHIDGSYIWLTDEYADVEGLEPA